jgi:hypothetical protein
MPGPQDPMSPQSPNPYAPPTAAASSWAPSPAPDYAPVHSGAPKVFGVLSIIFASITLFFSLFQSCGGLAAQGISRFGEMVPNADKAREIKAVIGLMGTVYTVIGIEGIVFMIMSALLLAIGIGQLRYREWAGRWSVYWGGIALACVAGMVALAFLFIGPTYQKFFELMAKATPTGAMPSGMGSSIGSLMGGTFGVIMIFFYAPYPILMLAFFSRDRVRSCMTN